MDAVTLRARAGRLAGRIFPALEEFAYNRDRSRQLPGSFSQWTDATRPPIQPRAPHLVIAPLAGPRSGDWGPARGNYYYEIYRTAVEHFGADSVSVLELDPGPPQDWADRLIEHLRVTQATHLIAHLERDPGDDPTWTWDLVWSKLAGQWDGVFVGITFDSGFPITRFKARRLARISPAFVCLDICVPLSGRLVRGRPEVGPVPLVISEQTQALLAEHLASVAKTTDVSFIGGLYPYRVELIEALRESGLTVAVNPHRNDVTTDLESSRKDQPGWLDYMAGLAGSQMTINFSLASSGNDEQLKWRVIEATLAGTLLLTDDRTRTSEFFERGTEFDRFTSPDDLLRVATWWLERPEELAAAQRRAQERAQGLARSEFWVRLSRTLAQRGLPALPPSTSGA